MNSTKLAKLIDRAIVICRHMHHFTVSDVLREALSIHHRKGGAGLPGFVEEAPNSFRSLESFICERVDLHYTAYETLDHMHEARRSQPPRRSRKQRSR